MLVPQRPEKKKLTILQMLRTDAAFDAWLKAIPNLDMAELAKSEADIIADREIGVSPNERLARLAQARKLAQALTVISVPVSVWGYFWPQPYEVAIAVLAALPMVAIALMARWGNLYQVAGSRNDGRASLAVVFIGPGIVLALRALLDIELFDSTLALSASAIGAAALTLFLAAVDRELRKHRWEILSMLLLSTFYVYGGIVEGNVLLDRSEPKIFEATVVDKRVSSGKSTTYYLRLAPWGPRREEDEVAVSRSLYDSIAPEQPVCIHFSTGALQIPWFVVQACR